MQKILLLPKKLFSARGLVAVFGLLIVGMLLLIIFVPDEQPQSTGITNQPQLTEEVKTKLATLSLDSDNDGLKDWEEPLYRTDLNNPDTDGDGTNDGDEIQQNRDPLKKRPNDAQSEPKTETLITNNQPNLTAELMSTLMQGGVLEYLAQGGDPDALPDEFYSRLQAIAGQSLELNVPTVSLSELRIISDSSTQAIKNYFNALANVYITHVFTLKQDDLVLFQEILESQDITRLQELDIYLTALDNSIATLKKIPTPKILASFHQKEINFMLKTRNEISIMKNTDNDPLASLIIIPQRIETEIAIRDFHTKEITGWLDERNIVFDKNEKASILLRAL